MNSHCLKWGIHFDLANKRDRVEELDKTMEDPGFWDDPEHSAKIVQESKKLKSVIERYESLESARDDILMLIEIAEEENDASVLEEVEDSLQQFEQEYESLRIETLLSGEYDKDNAILTLHAGAGGTESCDWASMLCRMYQRFAEKHGFEVEMLDFLDGDEAGYKSVTLQINGANAYGYLKSEHGVHRLVRISPFNAAGKRQTSFVSCDVISKKILMLRSQMMIFVSIHIVPVERVVSISIRLLLQLELPISRQGSWYSAKMNVHSI